MLLKNERVRSLFQQEIINMKSMHETNPAGYMQRAQSHEEFKALAKELSKSQDDLNLNLEEILLNTNEASPTSQK